MEYLIEPKVRELIEPSFISRIESLLSSYSANESKLYDEKIACKKSLVSKATAEVDALWKAKIKEYSGVSNAKTATIDSLLNNSKPAENLSDEQKQHLIAFLKASAIYDIVSREKSIDCFKYKHGPNNFYIHDMSASLKIGLDSSSFVKKLNTKISVNAINEFTDNIIEQLACAYPEYMSFDGKEASLKKELISEMSKFCLPGTNEFICSFSAEVTGCEIKRSIIKTNGDSIPVGPGCTRSFNQDIPCTVLSLDHCSVVPLEPFLSLDPIIIKKLTIDYHSIPASAGTIVSFDVNLSFPLNEVVPNIIYIDRVHHDNVRGGYNSSEFDKLYVRRKPKEEESLAKMIKLPGNISYEM